MQEKTTFKSLDEEEKGKVREMSQISLWLDRYTDIFSDFDPRPFSERALSVDFLEEIERATKEKKTGELELRLLIPSNKRNQPREGMIKKRLHNHFRKHHESFLHEMKEITRHGIIMGAIGIFFMFVATYIAFTYGTATLFLTFLVVLLEPAGWFLLWEGMSLLMFRPKRLKQSLEFYRKMSKAKVAFFTY